MYVRILIHYGMTNKIQTISFMEFLTNIKDSYFDLSHIYKIVSILQKININQLKKSNFHGY